MKNLAVTNLQLAKQAIEYISASDDAIIQAEQGSTGLDAQVCISNLRLLLDNIVRFYLDEEKAKFFPHSGDSEIHSQLSVLVANAQSFSANQNADHAKAVIQCADNLYGICLRLGIISFGLSQNEYKQVAQELAALSANPSACAGGAGAHATVLRHHGQAGAIARRHP